MQLSNKAIEAVKSGSKINAIKIVREESGMGLKDAKEFVETYIDTHPDVKQLLMKNSALSLPSVSTVVVLICIAVIVYYFMFGK